jgi:hypothetical protein
MTLDMFYKEEFKPFSEGHITALKASWKSITPAHKLFEFNRQWHTRQFGKCGKEQLEYYISLNIPHYSEWAKEILNA